MKLKMAVLAIALLASGAPGAVAEPARLINIVEGMPLDFSELDEVETDAVKHFKATGKNPYNTQSDKIAAGGSLFSTACSGCHGHLAEGKIGPGLADDYWTYPANVTDDGLFSSIFGGLQGQMGPQRGRLKQDEILQIMSWIRSVYSGAPEKADWRK